MTKRNYRTIAWRPALKNGATVKLELQLDEGDLLNWLGHKALNSKRGYSQIGSGAIRVKVVK